MMKKLSIFILLIFLVNISSVKAISDTPTLGELKQEYNSKLEEKKKTEQQTEEAKREIQEKEAAIKVAEGEIHAAEEELEVVEQNILESNKKIEQLTSEAEKLLIYLQQMQGQNAYVEYISGATTITDLITRIAAVEQVSDHIQTTMKDLEAEIARNEELKIDLKNKEAALERQVVIYKEVIAKRYSDINSYDKYALDIDTQIKSLKTKLEAAERNCKAYAPDKGDDAIVSKDCVKPVVTNTGQTIYVTNDGWLKPLPSGMVTSQVGYRWGSYHNALDIGGASPFEGTPVYAAAAGVVSGVINRYSCGGNMLYIDVTVNGQAYTTYYYHLLKFNVSIGDVVDQNTVIGYVGGYSTSTAHGGYDSCTTGAHLHFGVARGFYNGYSVPSSTVITPPGFPNAYGWSFSSRYDMY